jgi:hypothetical protein
VGYQQMLSCFVEFYRANLKPEIVDESRLEFSMALTERNIFLLSSLVTDSILRADALLLDGKYVDLSDLDIGSGTVNVELSIPTNGRVYIYKNLESLLIRNSSFLNGNADIEYYVTNGDYYSKEGGNPVYEKLNNITRLIAGLNDLAHYHDEKSKSKNRNLVYVSKSDATFLKPVVIRPQITTELLEGNNLDISLICDLLDDSGNEKNVIREKGVFRSTIIEFFQESQASEEEKFEYLVSNWAQFSILFSQNFDTYLSGYAFKKVKHEIAGIEIKLAEQFSKVTNDITGKLLGAPLSFAAIIALVKVETGLEQMLVLMGIVIAAWILSSIIKNQYEQFLRVKNARSILFSSHESLKVKYPDELQEALQSAVDALDLSEDKLSTLMIKFRVLCWLPVFVSIIVLLHKYWPQCA